MEAISEALLVFGLSIVDLLLAIPIGIAFDQPPLLVGVLSALGGVLGVVIFVGFGTRLVEWTRARRASKGKPPKDDNRRRRWLRGVFDRYGVPGLGLLAPVLTTVPVGMLLGVALGAAPRRLTIWGIAGAVFWSVLGTTVVALGADSIGFL